MGLTVDEIQEMARILKRFKKPKKRDPEAIKKMIGKYKYLAPEDKSSVDLIREQRAKILGVDAR